MTGQELERQVHDFIDQEQFKNALDSINCASYGEIKLDKPHLLKLWAYLHDNGVTFEHACAIWWALPSGSRIEEETGQITPIGEVAHKLYEVLLKKLKWIGMEKSLGYELEFDVAVPPNVVLALATEYATSNGVHDPALVFAP